MLLLKYEPLRGKFQLLICIIPPNSMLEQLAAARRNNWKNQFTSVKGRGFQCTKCTVGGRATDGNGQVLEDFIGKYDLVVLYYGRSTWFGINKNTHSYIDITLASGLFAQVGE